MGWLVVVLLVIILMVFVSCLKIVPQAQAYVIERLGAYQGTWSVGFHVKVPFLDKVARRVNLNVAISSAARIFVLIVSRLVNVWSSSKSPIILRSVVAVKCQATTILLPAELQGIASIAETWKEGIKR